jgi:prepilin-type N-terminal cleavage/methylation domain-containing protein
MRTIRHKKPVNTPAGFTIVELMIVVTTIGILALLSTPSIQLAAARTEATVTANDIRVFTEAIEFYSSSEGAYPESMSYTHIPDKIANFLPNTWKDGNYSWFYVNTNQFIYIYLYNLNFTSEQALLLDRIIDDSNIATGKVRMAYSGSGIVYLFQHQLGEIDPETGEGQG